MTVHAMARVAAVLRSAGLEAWELDGWDSNQPGYLWADPDGTEHRYDGEPSGHMVHHTATIAYTPQVRDRHGRTKANVWLGLRRGGRLYYTGGGTPTLVLASAGPANYSSGSGVLELLTDYVSRDRRFHGPQTQPDTPGYYGNRHYWNTEVVHPGDGSPLDPAVWDLLVRYCAVLATHMGWSPWRTVGHLDHTTRKIDPRFAQGHPYTIAALQDAQDREMTMRLLYPKLGDGPDTSQETAWRVEAFQIQAVEAATGQRFDHTRPSREFLEPHGLTVGLFDQAFAQLLADLLNIRGYDGSGIGPREEAGLRNLRDRALGRLNLATETVEVVRSVTVT